MADIWKRKKYFSFMIGSQTLKNQDEGYKYKSQTSLALQWDWFHIRFHKKPIAKMVMIGFDIAFDANYTKYKDIENLENDNSEDRGSILDDAGLGDLDMMQIDAGLALGPIVEVAPFSYTDNAARHLKAFVYYHMAPSYSGVIIDEEVYSAFNMFHGIGFGLTWKWVSLGYEYRFGSAKYDNFSIDEDEVSYDESGVNVDDVIQKDKVKLKTTMNRFFIRFNF